VRGLAQLVVAVANALSAELGFKKELPSFSINGKAKAATQS
jgi:hypothetical protein